MRTPGGSALRGLSILCAGLLFLGCAESETAGDTEAMDMPAMTLGDFAGMWTVQTLPETGDSALITFTMNAVADPAGWTMTFPDGRTVNGMVTLDGDSVMGHFGPYQSALRAGVMVEVRSIMRIEGDRMMGTFKASYETDAPDSVLNGRLDGSRMMHDMDEMD